MKRIEMIKLMEEKELIGDFNCNICPPNQNFLEVPNDYDYLRSGFFKTIGDGFTSGIFKFASIFFGKHFNLKIIGKKNLKLIKNTGAIVTCNHVHKLDCILIRNATINRKLKIIVGEFNNYKGIGGSLLRSAATMPLSSKSICMKNLYKAVGSFLDKKQLILLYPEASLWYCYEKPRPLLNGAYHFATKFNAPIVPMFFTFKNKKKRKDGTYKKKFVLHIGEPIYKSPNLTDKENIEFLKNQNYLFNTTVYENFYNQPLIFPTKKEL